MLERTPTFFGIFFTCKSNCTYAGYTFVISQKTIMPCANVTSGLTESRNRMTAFCLTKDELFSRFYIKINNGNMFKQ